MFNSAAKRCISLAGLSYRNFSLLSKRCRVRMLLKAVLSFTLLFFCVAGLYAQDVEQMAKQLTPEQKKTLLKMSPAQRKELAEEYGVSILGDKGAAHPPAATAKKSAEFEGMTIDTPVSGAKSAEKQSDVAALHPVGYEYFAPARQRIITIEQAIRSGKVPEVRRKEALEGYVGPLDMISSHVDTGTPERYFLSSGDVITLAYWSSDQQQETVTIVIDDDGSVEIPGAGRFIAQGMTLDQFESAAYNQFKRVSTAMDFNLVATMERLKSISVDIRGEAFRPGSYKISSVTTLFNALLACGGPSDNGSLRNIRLLRGKKFYHVDFYDYLINGSTGDNYALQGGDIIFIPKAGRKVELSGEVYLPAIYELNESEGLREIISLAGGVKPTAVTAQILIHTIVPGKEKVVRTIDLNKKSDIAATALQDGDRVSVRPVSKVAVNYVTAQGNVYYPGDYELVKNMRVKDLLVKAELLPDTYTEQIVLIRYNKEDKTTTRINIDLSSLLKGDKSQDLMLQDLDELRIYSKEEAKYIPKREVRIIGHVQRPGTYSRSEEMRLKALLFAAGGLLPGYYNVLHISRARTDKETEVLTINVDNLLAGMETANVQLYDNDVVTVRRRSDFYETPKWVTIRGEVNVPGPYALKNKAVTLRQLLEMAGGFTESAYPKGIMLRRESKYITFGDQINLLRRANRSAVEELRQAYLRARARNSAQLAVLQGKEIEDASSASARFGMPAITDADDLEKTLAASTIPSIAESGGKVAEKTFELAESSPALGVSKREFGESELLFDEKERIVVDIDKILKDREDMVLKPGDEIIVPQIPETVSIVGAVSTPLTLGFGDDRWVDDYIERVGGYAEDADEDRVRVVRMDGTIMLVDDIEQVERGDIIYVPTKVMTADIKTSTDKILDVVKYSVSTAASLLIFFSLVGGL